MFSPLVRTTGDALSSVLCGWVALCLWLWCSLRAGSRFCWLGLALGCDLLMWTLLSSVSQFAVLDTFPPDSRHPLFLPVCTPVCIYIYIYIYIYMCVCVCVCVCGVCDCVAVCGCALPVRMCRTPAALSMQDHDLVILLRQTAASAPTQASTASRALGSGVVSLDQFQQALMSAGAPSQVRRRVGESIRLSGSTLGQRESVCE
jgi:hypothetical protein